MRRALAGLAVLTVTALLAVLLGLLLAGVAHAQSTQPLYIGQPVYVDGSYLLLDAATGLPTFRIFQAGVEVAQMSAGVGLWRITDATGSVTPLSIAITPNATLAVTGSSPFYGTPMVLAHPSIAPVSETYGIGYPMGYSGPQFAFGGGFTGNCNFEDANGNDALEPSGTPGEACFATRLNWIAGRCVEFNSFGQLVPADDACGSGGGASALDDLTDVTIASAAVGHVLAYNGSEWVNDDTLTWLVPADALSMDGAAPTASGLAYCSAGFLSAGVTNYDSGAAAGSGPHASYITQDTSYQILAPGNAGNFDSDDGTEAWNKADQGSLVFRINGVTNGTLNLGSLFDEGERAGTQSWPPSTNDDLTVTAVAWYNDFPSRQRGVAHAQIDQADHQTGWNAFSFFHDLATADQTSADFDVFADFTSAPSISGTPTVAENTPSFKHLSGVKFYANTSTFNLSTACTSCFSNTFLANPLAVAACNNTTCSGLTVSPTAIAWNDASVSGVSSPPNISETMTVTNRVVTMTTSSQRTANLRFGVTPSDPCDAGSQVLTASAGRLYDSFGTTSTASDEPFDDENRRLPADAYDTCPGTLTGQWTSSTALTNGQAQVYQGQLIYPSTNFTSGFLPTQGSVNYSGFSGSQVYYRAVVDSGVPHSTGSLQLVGLTEADVGQVGSGNVNVELKVCGGVTGWLDLGKAFAGAAENDGDGAKVSVVGNTWNWSIGTNSTIDNSIDGYILRVTFRVADTIDAINETAW